MNKLLSAVAAITLAASTASADIERDTFTTESAPGVSIAIHEVRETNAASAFDPVILLHGARVPGIPSFDLRVPGGSLAADLAAAGHDVYIVDIRGYGTSTRLPEMTKPREATEALVRSGAAVVDIRAAVDAVLARSGKAQVNLLGWATGGHWAGMYAALEPHRVARVVFYNTLYGYSAEHAVIGRGSRLASETDPGAFNIDLFQNYRLNAGNALLRGWDRSIPLEDKTQWRDPAVAEAYVQAALASDPTSETRDPASFRAPSGAMADSFLLATGATLWDARLIQADALIIRSGRDFWSRPADVTLLQEHLGQRRSGTVATVNIPEATHFVHLDRAERGRQLFLDAVIGFLGGTEG